MKMRIVLAIGLFPLGAATGETEVSFTKKQLTSKFYCEGAAIGDFNKDGKPDVVSGPYWYAGPDFSKASEFYPAKEHKPKGYSRNFNTFAGDLNGDGWDDVLVVAFPGQEALWYENPKGGEGLWKERVAVDVVDNESPQFLDLTGDGQKELICSQGGVFCYATFDPKKPEAKWVVHKISPEKATGGKFTHGLGIGDVDGDGKMDLLEKSSWWKQPDSLEGDPVWKRLQFQFSGPGGSDMFAYDFDGDGDNDIFTSSAAHAYGLAWFEQHEGEDGRKTWKRHVVTGSKKEENPFGVVFSQAHSIQLVDIDGDGVKDIVTGKRWWAHNGKDPGGNDAAVVYWFKVKPGGKSGAAEFVPYQIDADSGVGTQFMTGDLTGDGLLDIVVGNKKGTFVHTQARGERKVKPGPQ